jgi:hypothetical protein
MGNLNVFSTTNQPLYRWAPPKSPETLALMATAATPGRRVTLTVTGDLRRWRESKRVTLRAMGYRFRSRSVGPGRVEAWTERRAVRLSTHHG